MVSDTLNVKLGSTAESMRQGCNEELKGERASTIRHDRRAVDSLCAVSDLCVWICALCEVV